MNHSQLYKNTNVIMDAARRFLREAGFIELMPSLLSSYLEPGAKHSVVIMGKDKLPEVDKGSDDVVARGHRHYFLPVSMVVEKQLALEYNDKVFCFAPCIRLFDKFSIGSNKHLITFTQLEIEIRSASIDIAQETIKGVLNYIGSAVKNSNLEGVNYTHVDSLISEQYPKLEFEEAVSKVRNEESSKLEDLSALEEKKLCDIYETPFFIQKYPVGVRDSIFHEKTQGYHETFDLYLPYGYGEVSTGGVRAKSAEEIEHQAKDLGSSQLTQQANYIEWKRKTGISSAGFGIGFERLIHFIHNTEDILEIIQPHIQGPNNTIDRTQGLP